MLSAIKLEAYSYRFWSIAALAPEVIYFSMGCHDDAEIRIHFVSLHHMTHSEAYKFGLDARTNLP